MLQNIIRQMAKPLRDLSPGAQKRKRERAQALAIAQRQYQTEAWAHFDGYCQRTTLGSDSEYVADQRSKLNEMIAAGTAQMLPKDVAMFQRRFELVSLTPRSKILCMAARLGAEVEAWRLLGHPDTIGIDLNPGPDNPRVIPGNFHELPFGDGSLDVLYFNSFDHARYIETVMSEGHRVLKPGGLFVVDLVAGYQEGYIVGRRDVTHWPHAEGFAKRLAALGGFAFERFTDLRTHGSPLWTQSLLRKPQSIS